MNLHHQIVLNLSVHIDKFLAEDLLVAYNDLVAKHKSGDAAAALTKAGRFVEHAFRVIECIRVGSPPPEIKSVETMRRNIEGDTSLHESLRLLIPRVLSGMIYNIRNKRNAVHVKEIDPKQIDVAMSVSAASWVVAELLRLYHSSSESVVEQCMRALNRVSIPLIETIDGETIVGRGVTSRTEILLLLFNANPCGLTRTEIGKSASCSPSSVTTVLQNLIKERFVHLSRSKKYFIMAAGEAVLEDSLAP